MSAHSAYIYAGAFFVLRACVIGTMRVSDTARLIFGPSRNDQGECLLPVLYTSEYLAA